MLVILFALLKLDSRFSLLRIGKAISTPFITFADIAHTLSSRKTVEKPVFWLVNITVSLLQVDHEVLLLILLQGWSYGLAGNLAKAPKYQDLDGFNREANGLYPIHVHVDKMGFVWINLDANKHPEVAWEDDFKGVDMQPRLEAFDMSKYRFDHQWEMLGDYNWKTLADNYNEVCFFLDTFSLNYEV